MAHTAEDLVEYCKEKNLMEELVDASRYNRYGFQYMVADGKLIQKEDKIFVRLDLDGKINEYPMEMSLDQFEEIMREKYPYCMGLCFEQDGDGTMINRLLLALGEGGETQEQVEQVLYQIILVEFLRACGIDTLYELYNLLEEGKTIRQEGENSGN